MYIKSIFLIILFRELTNDEKSLEINWQHKIAPKRKIIYPNGCPLFSNKTLKSTKKTLKNTKLSARNENKTTVPPLLSQTWVTEVVDPTPSERIALNYSQPLGHASPRIMNLQKKKATPTPEYKNRPASSLGFGHLLPKEDKIRPFRPVSASPRTKDIFDYDSDEDFELIGNPTGENNDNLPVYEPKSNLLPHYPKSAPLYDKDFIYIDESRLPVYYYDHQEYEIKTPEQWLANGPVKGRSPMYENGAYIWAPCNVLKYDNEKSKYLIEFLYSGKEKWVRRLNLMMEYYL